MSPRASPKKARTDIDELCINTIRCLSIDMVQAANSGHPGAPLGCAPIAHALFGHEMALPSFNASEQDVGEEEQSVGRLSGDRFVLSNGHACALLYAMLHLTGAPGMTTQQLRHFRQMDSLVPGHPERLVTPGVEVTTGPLGQGVANAVGLAVAQRHQLLGTAAEGTGEAECSAFVFCLTGDGCLQEGVSGEAASLAGHWKLGNLIVVYDDNRITIDGATDLSFTEDVSRRFQAYGWEVVEVADGDRDVQGIVQAIKQAKRNTTQPTLIKVRTTIGYGSSKAGSEKTHGSPLGPEEIKLVKAKLHMDPEASFQVPAAVAEFYKVRRLQAAEREKKFVAKHGNNELLRRKLQVNPGWKLPNKSTSDNFAKEIFQVLHENVKFNSADALATRATSGACLAALVKKMDIFMGGSADLTESNVSNKANLEAFSAMRPDNRYLHFGVREHAMVAIANGMHAFGGVLPFVATFANFIGYCWGALRLSALSHHQLLFLGTHDSIDLGEDGPTHQPVEIQALLRATPNVLDFRPADGEETKAGYVAFARHAHGPTVMLLSRGAVPQITGSCVTRAQQGAYVISDFTDGKPANKAVILAGNGTELSLLVKAEEELVKEGVSVRVVSMPSWFLFEQQTAAYKRSVFPKDTPVLMVEACRLLGAEKYATAVIDMQTFGASAPAKALRDKFGFTVGNVVAKAKTLLMHH